MYITCMDALTLMELFSCHVMSLLTNVFEPINLQKLGLFYLFMGFFKHTGVEGIIMCEICHMLSFDNTIKFNY